MSNSTLMRYLRQWHHPNYLWIVILLVGGLAAGGYFLIRDLHRSRVLAPFEPARSEYATLRPGDEVRPTGGFCKGCIITIDAVTNQFDPIFFVMPDDLKPRDPASVKTVVFLRWTVIKKGQYPDGRFAFQNQCDIELVDRESKALLKRTQVLGSAPPQFVNRWSSSDGTMPTDEVIAFVRDNTKK